MLFSCSMPGLHRSQADFPAQLEVSLNVCVWGVGEQGRLFIPPRTTNCSHDAARHRSRSKRRRQGSDQEQACSTPFLCCFWQSHYIFPSFRFHTSLENIHTWLSQQAFWSQFFPVKSFAQESDASHIYVLNFKSYVFSQVCFNRTPISYHCEWNIRSSPKNLRSIPIKMIRFFWYVVRERI